MCRTNNARSSVRLKELVLSGLFLALALALPFLTGQVPQIGAMLCPMHLPVLLCGFICGWPWGLAVGFIAPLLRFALFGMPVILPTGLAMAFELAAYGAASGILYHLLPKKKLMIYAALIAAMIFGRLVWGGAMLTISGLEGNTFGAAAFLTSAFVNAIPGIICQIVLVPIIIIALEKAGLMPDSKQRSASGA